MRVGDQQYNQPPYRREVDTLPIVPEGEYASWSFSKG